MITSVFHACLRFYRDVTARLCGQSIHWEDFHSSFDACYWFPFVLGNLGQCDCLIILRTSMIQSFLLNVIQYTMMNWEQQILRDHTYPSYWPRNLRGLWHLEMEIEDLWVTTKYITAYNTLCYDIWFQEMYRDFT